MIKRVKSSRSSSSSSGSYKVNKVLIENFVTLQKVMTNFSKKFDELNKQISKLLQLFEISAKSFAKKDFTLESPDTKKLSQKMDNLLEQNKTIARGLTLIHEVNKIPTTPQPSQTQQPLQPSQPQVTQPTIPQQAIQPIQPVTSQAQQMPKAPPSADAEQYQKSISSANEQDQKSISSTNEQEQEY